MGVINNPLIPGRVLINSWEMTGISGTSPTTVAAVNTFLGDSGVIFMQYQGAAATNKDDASFTFQVPDDYQKNGKIEINYVTDAASVNNVKLQMIITKPALNSDMNIQTETGLSVTFQAIAAYLRKVAIITPVTTVFAAKDLVICRLYRLKSDAADTSTANCFVASVAFVYDNIL